jgi:hypothetical protein
MKRRGIPAGDEAFDLFSSYLSISLLPLLDSYGLINLSLSEFLIISFQLTPSKLSWMI